MSLFFADARHHYLLLYLVLTKLTKLAKILHILIETPRAIMALLPVSTFKQPSTV